MIQDEAGQRSLNFQSYKERITNFSNEFELGLFIHIVRRSLLWIILVMLLALASAFIYLRYTAPTYSTRSILQLRESNTAQQILNVETFVEDKNLQADVELMRSPFFVGKALDRLDLDVSYFNRGQILTEEYYTRSFFKIKEISVYNDRVRDIPIAVDLSNPTRVTLSYSVGGKVQEFSFAAMEIIRTPDLSCILEVSENHVSQNDGDERSLYFKINSRKALINQYLSQIQVRIADNNAQTVEISCMDENPYLARDLAQAMAETFIDYDVERKTESAANIIRFIRAQKDTVFEQLRGSEYELQQFKVDNKVTGLGQLTPMYIEQSELYENELVKIEQDIALLTEIQRATDRPLPEISVYDLMPLLVGTEYQQTLASMIRTMEDLLRERDAIYLDATREHQSVRSLEYQIDLQKQLILASITSIRDRALVRKKELLTTLSEIDRKFLALPEKELRYARIERLFNINEKYYTQLLEKDVEYRISKAGFVPENQILEDAAQPQAPLYPQRNVVILSYLLAGLILSMIIILVRYILHDNITSLHDIAKQSNASIGILGMIPKYKKDIPISQLLIDKNPKSLIAESFRSIRTNLQFIDNSPGPKTIAVTSTISGEGKTFVAINLGGIISFGGKRVIILDLDMRKPKIHLGFGVENVKGMSTVLIGKDAIADCIQQSTLPGLDFITAGPIPPNPSELIIDPRMVKVINELRTSYDVVLIDNPPWGS
ncbi:MAG: polysaccharide biosynthesis tyrosine autokinase [Flavobacteriales bacterium]|nr:polysaccharide biosynthesis tyrosine autokinase [Flavobacteriales bacterium]